ncbi:hypothetical protein [Amycolatopsis sp. NPDC059657]|uniref:PspA-associated protein PspAB n=1 Tax=Amycolatopsis sp. NPDC059657 TaxID=3346899 RepID=UPI00366F4943
MTLLGNLLGRSKTSGLQLEGLPAASAVAAKLRSEFGLLPTGGGSVCFKVTGSPAELTRAEIIAATAGDRATHNLVSHELTGRTIVRCWRPGGALRLLLTDLVDVNQRLAEAGFGSALLHTTIDFTETGGRRGRKLVLVFLPGRGTFYPFMPTGRRSRDRDGELRVRGLLRRILPVEADVDRWLPV